MNDQKCLLGMKECAVISALFANNEKTDAANFGVAGVTGKSAEPDRFMFFRSLVSR
jgi:hypothetical protein